MKKAIVTLSTIVFVLILSGCAKISPIMEASETKSGFAGAVYSGEKVSVSDNKEGLIEYRVFEQAETGFVPLSKVLDNVEKRANKYCEQRNLSYRAISEQTSVPPHILGNFPRVELVFVCEEASKSKSKNFSEAYQQLEVLGNLLEKGLITKEEFDLQKAKIFSK
ncbi:SHOCT domain-containing protein [Aliarcobacter cryaerophilus]|uniref:SHOCT domain-containing protein n=1 Tax=Aliarcobacter cryaerophilus TaxID=28198 RepID=UPI003DA43C73